MTPIRADAPRESKLRFMVSPPMPSTVFRYQLSSHAAVRSLVRPSTTSHAAPEPTAVSGVDPISHCSKEAPMKISHYMAGAAAMALLALGPGAMAQQGRPSGQPGSTSGPAAGSPVQPSTAVQKQTPGAAPQGMTGAQAQQGGVGAGAPGVTAKPGTEGGPAPKPNQSSATAERESMMPGMDQEGMGMMQGTEVAQGGDWGWRGHGGSGPGGWGRWGGGGGWGHSGGGQGGG